MAHRTCSSARREMDPSRHPCLPYSGRAEHGVGAGPARLRARERLRRPRRDEQPGGAWQHRWPTLTVARTPKVHELPGLPFPAVPDEAAAADAVPAHFAEYEQRFGLPVHRPVRMRAVRRADGGYLVETSAGSWRARALVDATGTWSRPFVPHYPPGQDTFGGGSCTPSTTAAPRPGTGVSWTGCRCSAGSPRTAWPGTTAASRGPTSSSGRPAFAPPSASTIGTNRPGQAAARALRRSLRPTADLPRSA
jgi:hypothetical protein